MLQQIVTDSKTKRECLEKIGIHNSSSSSYKTLNYHLKIYNINTDHFVTYNEKTLHINRSKQIISLSDILDGKYPLYGTSNLRTRLIKENIMEHKCSECTLTEWMGKPIPLDLDHIDGDPSNHKLENLRLLCRNCHAQTDTFCGKNSTKTTKIKDKKHKFKARMDLIKVKNENKVELVKNSNIDLTVFGWVTEVAKLLDMQPQKINGWITKWMPNEYNELCFKRKSSH